MFPRDPSESSHRQKRSPSPADHSGSNSSPSREYSPPAARRRQTSRAPAKSTTHRHNFSPSRRWEVNCMDFISMNNSSLETSSVGLTTCSSYVSLMGMCVPQTVWALRCFFFPSYYTERTCHVRNTSHGVGFHLPVPLKCCGFRWNFRSLIWDIVHDPLGTFVFPHLPPS